MTAYEDDIHHFSVHFTLTIRQAQREDMRKLEWRGEFSHLRELFERSYREQLFGRRHLLVADSGGYPVGRLFILLNGHNAKRANGSTHAYLYSLQVMSLFQGKGIGTRLIDAAEALLRQRGFAVVSIAVAKDNPRAQALYERLGYVVVDENEGRWQYRDHRGKQQDVHEPCWILEKSLR